MYSFENYQSRKLKYIKVTKCVIIVIILNRDFSVFTFGGLTAPKIEIQQHLNRGFVEDDEGIAESGL